MPQHIEYADGCKGNEIKCVYIIAGLWCEMLAAAALLNYCRNSVSTFNKREEHLFTVSYGSQYEDSSGALGKQLYSLQHRENMGCRLSLMR